MLHANAYASLCVSNLPHAATPTSNSDKNCTEEDAVSVCVICFDPLASPADGSGEVTLSCCHHFHFSCVQRWFASQQSTGLAALCPVCACIVLPPPARPALECTVLGMQRESDDVNSHFGATLHQTDEVRTRERTVLALCSAVNIVFIFVLLSMSTAI
jgi:hypothetical protein